MPCAPSCSPKVLTTLVGGYSCASRIDWLQSTPGGGLTELAACAKVVDEFPIGCSGCAPLSRVAPASPPSPPTLASPPSPPTPPFTMALYERLNCYRYHGAVSAGDSGISAGSVADCTAICKAHTGCEGFVSTRPGRTFGCWLIRDIVLAKCERDGDYDVYAAPAPSPPRDRLASPPGAAATGRGRLPLPLKAAP